jgi:hypothetical protein
MKFNRRRRPLRPRPSRAQVLQQIRRLRNRLQLFQLEWILEAGRPDRNLVHLRRLHQGILECQEEIATLETC